MPESVSDTPISPLRKAMADIGISSDLKSGVQIAGGSRGTVDQAHPLAKVIPAGMLPARAAGKATNNTHPAYRDRTRKAPPPAAGGGLAADGWTPPLSAYDEEMVSGDAGYPDMPDTSVEHAVDADSADLIIIRFDPRDPRFAWRGFSARDYRGQDAEKVGTTFAAWSASMTVTPSTWRGMMARLDRHPPATQKTMLHTLDVWAAQIGPDWIALDEQVVILERDMALPHEQVQAAMLLIDLLIDCAGWARFRHAHTIEGNRNNQGEAVFDKSV